MPPTRLALSVAEACKALGGISRTTLWRLEKRELIKAVPNFYPKIYSVEVLKRFVDGKAGK